MKKKLFVILLAAALVLAVYGCSITPSPTTSINPGTSSQTVPTTTEETLPWAPLDLVNHQFSGTRDNPDYNYKITRQVLPETVDNPKGLPVLKWVCLICAGNQVWNEAAVVELNQMLADKELPYRVQFTLLSASKSVLMPWDWFTNPEVQKELEDADLIYGYYTAQDMEQWLRPITDHIYGEAQPALADTMPDLLSWYSFEANGEIYGIPETFNVMGCPAWEVDLDFMKEFDLTVEDFQKNFWEMDELFAGIYEKNGNQIFLKDHHFRVYGGRLNANSTFPFLPMGRVFDFSAYQGICLNFSIDLQAERPTVVNMLETELFSTLHDAALRYLKAGYMSTPGAPDNLPIQYHASKPTTEPYRNEREGTYIIPCGSKGLPSLDFTNMTGIYAGSSYPKESLSLLEQIMTDDALRLQLCYGKEGRDYTLTDGVYTLITQEDGSRYYMDYLSPQTFWFEFTSTDEETAWLVGTTSDFLILKREGMSRLESYKKDMDYVSFCHCPIVFDLSNLDAELAVLEQVLDEYYPMFLNEEHYSEEYFQRMLRDLNEAGMQTVITELQRQLDAWIAEHPNWDPLERS